jgi:hypothetical protein
MKTETKFDPMVSCVQKNLLQGLFCHTESNIWKFVFQSQYCVQMFWNSNKIYCVWWNPMFKNMDLRWLKFSASRQNTVYTMKVFQLSGQLQWKGLTSKLIFASMFPVIEVFTTMTRAFCLSPSQACSFSRKYCSIGNGFIHEIVNSPVSPKTRRPHSSAIVMLIQYVCSYPSRLDSFRL